MSNTNPSNAPHDSAIGHVTGEATYIDDLNIPQNTHHIAFALSKVAHGKINSIDCQQAWAMPGVKAVLLSQDIEREFGHLLIGPVQKDEPLLAKDTVLFYGQALCAVLAQTHQQATLAAATITADIIELEPIVTVGQAIEKESYLNAPIKMKTGDAKSAIPKADYQIKGELDIGGQEHFYLETQTALAIPKEKDEIVVHSSTQNPTEVQHLVAEVLGVPMHSVEVLTRRMGGGFGGKETDSSQIACLSALFAKKYNIPVKARLPRYEDFLMTGKRHDFVVKYEVGFNSQGIVQGIIIDYYAKCGYSLDLSYAIVSRTLFHSDNCYYFENAQFRGFLCKTNTTSNTAFRGFGGPQGMLAIENIMQEVAQFLGEDACVIRQRNFYQKNAPKNITPYQQIIEENIISELTDSLLTTSNYSKRKEQITQFNATHNILKKGLAFSPVKFGVSFTTTFLNQAGALVNVYNDGSIYLNHGGTEMGQGLFTKIAYVVAMEFGVSMECIKVSATSTAKVPNTSATAASSGSDMNGKAAQIACQRIKENMINFASEHFSISKKQIAFSDGEVILDKQKMPFTEFVKLCYLNRVELFSNGFYKTPKIHYDRETATGRPFYYYAYGVSVSEVLLDCITGEYKITAVDILHDVGNSLNKAIDKGQIVGAYIQGIGWLCTEELKWDDKGRLTTTGPATYKIPSIGDTPKHLNVEIQNKYEPQEDTIFKSKAVGEPPFMLAISSWLAIKDAIYNARQDKKAAKLPAPATFEQVHNGLHLDT